MTEYDYRGRSTTVDRRDMQIQSYTGPPEEMSGNFYEYETTSKGKKKKSKKSSSASGNKWSFSDPEFQRKRRVASYKVYAVEGRVKGTFRNGFRWLKRKCVNVVSWW